MLTKNDFCDYETCVALEELGYDDSTDLRYNSYGSLGNFLGGIKAPTLYEAQKWLRNTHNLHISTKPYPCEDGLMWMYEIRRFTPYLVCVIKNKTGFREAEKALSKGIKEAVKILKEK